jgi:hypothetical protein
VRRLVERNFETVALAVVALAWSGVFYVGHYLDNDRTVLENLRNSHTAVYAAIASLFGTIFGFTVTAISIILAFAQSSKLVILRGSRHWRKLWSIFTRGVWVSSSVAIMALIGLVFDRDARPEPSLTYAMIFALMLGVVRLFLIAWAFQKLVIIMVRPDPPDDVRQTEIEGFEEAARLR